MLIKFKKTKSHKYVCFNLNFILKLMHWKIANEQKYCNASRYMGRYYTIIVGMEYDSIIVFNCWHTKNMIIKHFFQILDHKKSGTMYTNENEISKIQVNNFNSKT